MFRRLVFENTAALFTLAAFITAVSIYVTIAWRALRMKGPQIARFANLPFETETPESAPTGRNDTAGDAASSPRFDRRPRRGRRSPMEEPAERTHQECDVYGPAPSDRQSFCTLPPS